jgi:hypothetical protein
MQIPPQLDELVVVGSRERGEVGQHQRGHRIGGT